MTTRMDFPIQLTGQLREHLRSLRKARGLTQAALGQLLGVGQARIAEISRRNRAGAENVTQSAADQARALRELEGAASELREVAADLSDLTRRIARVTSHSSN